MVLTILGDELQKRQWDPLGRKDALCELDIVGGRQVNSEMLKNNVEVEKILCTRRSRRIPHNDRILGHLLTNGPQFFDRDHLRCVNVNAKAVQHLRAFSPAVFELANVDREDLTLGGGEDLSLFTREFQLSSETIDRPALEYLKLDSVPSPEWCHVSRNRLRPQSETDVECCESALFECTPQGLSYLLFKSRKLLGSKLSFD